MVIRRQGPLITQTIRAQAYVSHLRSLAKKERDQFLNYLTRGWTVSAASRQCGFTPGTFYSLRERDKEFAVEWDLAYKEGTDLFEAEVNRRAFQGTLKPVYQQGRRVGTIREFSDQLAALVLKKRNPEFKERHEVSGTGKDGAFTFVIADKRESDL